jgi:autophagy-related protein 17
MSSPTSRSHTSVSPAASQAHSATEDLVPLEALVSHLLASKRSLSSISTVWRANEIVTSARSALEESVILSSKTMYLRDGISEQVKILRNVRGGIESVYKDGQREFEVHIHGCVRTPIEANISRTSSKPSTMPTQGWSLQ